MRIYVGQGNSSAGTKKMREARASGLGLCLCPGELPPNFGPWFLDNGAFRAFRRGAPFDEVAFARALADGRDLGADFAVTPDVVGGGEASLALSVAWVGRLDGYRPYLAVQDGMTEGAVEEVLPLFAGLFVGGSVPWKLATGASWVGLSHRHGKPCHVGRVGTPSRLAWAKEIGADSIDSSQPLWTDGKWRAFLKAALDLGLIPSVPESVLRDRVSVGRGMFARVDESLYEERSS